MIRVIVGALVGWGCAASAPPPEAEEPVAPTVQRSEGESQAATARSAGGEVEAEPEAAAPPSGEGLRLVVCVDVAAADGAGLLGDVVQSLARHAPNDVARAVLEGTGDRFDRVALVYPLPGAGWELLIGHRRAGAPVVTPTDPDRHRQWTALEAAGDPASLEAASASSEGELAASSACPARLLGFRVDQPLDVRLSEVEARVERIGGRVVPDPAGSGLLVEVRADIDTEANAALLERRGSAALDRLRNGIVLRSLLRGAALTRRGATLELAAPAQPSQVRLLLTLASGFLAGGASATAGASTAAP